MEAKGIFRNVTPAAKLALVNQQIGNGALKRNQGSSYEVFCYADVTSTIGTKQTIRFFDNVNTITFPFTNIQQNQLNVGESLAIEYIAFTRWSVSKSGAVTQTPLTGTAPGLCLSQFSFLLDNSRILKNNSLTRTNTYLNPHGATAENNLFYPDTNLVIPPQISFSAELTTPAGADALADTEAAVYYGIHIFGSAAILNLKANV